MTEPSEKFALLGREFGSREAAAGHARAVAERTADHETFERILDFTGRHFEKTGEQGRKDLAAAVWRAAEHAELAGKVLKVIEENHGHAETQAIRKHFIRALQLVWPLLTAAGDNKGSGRAKAIQTALLLKR
ncbi:MAG: hypothetical protein V1787_04895 [Candidatus Micrarchaeota archaeon]